MPAVDRDEALRELGRMSMEKREDAGLSLEDIFEKTRVRVEYLRGIEQGVYHGFPDLVYVKGFVRTYLSVIGAEELKDEFMLWLGKDASTGQRGLPAPNVLGKTSYPTKGFKPASHFWLFVILFLVLVGSGCYVWYSWSNNSVIIPRFEPNPQAGVTLSNDDSADVLPLSQDDYMTLIPASASLAPAVSEPEPEPVSPYLHLKATGLVWVEARINGRERAIVYRNLQPGEEVSFDLPARATVRYGRADMTTVILNGKELQNASSRGTYYYNPDGTFNRP